MNALLILDAQNGILNKIYNESKEKILLLIDIFKKNNDLIISTRHIDDEKNSIINKDSQNSEIDEDIRKNTDYILEKLSPNVFMNTKLQEILKKNNISKLYVVGYNIEYCCLFTAIAAADRGYEVCLIEDACGTVNNGNTYDMDDLDIVDFIGCIFDWSGSVEVLYYDEYIQEYNR